MSVVTYDAGQMLLTIDDTGVERALGSLYRKTPAVLKVAINRTARQARKDLIAEAEKRYALTVRGKARLRLLKLRKSATNNSLVAELRQSDEGLTLNASYFQHSPTVPRMGVAALHGPACAHVARRANGGADRHREREQGIFNPGKQRQERSPDVCPKTFRLLHQQHHDQDWKAKVEKRSRERGKGV